jgi:hypothetical protein
LAFISEIHYRSTDTGTTGNEFVEITLGPGEDPADFVVSLYNHAGTLDTSVEAGGLVGGEVTLSDLTGVPDPENPGYTIYTVVSTEIEGRLFNGGDSSSNGQANHVALTNTATSTVHDAYSIYQNPGRALTGGEADGATTTSTGPAAAGQTLQWDSSGNETAAASTPNDSNITCFLRGTRIRTPHGDIAVEKLSIGDLVVNVNGVAHPIRWIGSTRLSGLELARNPKLRPVRISKDALGPGMPTADLLVSRQHRMLARSKVAERMFGAKEVLLSAIRLTDLPGVFIDNSQEATEYFHVLFDRHEIIIAEGAATESLHTGPQAMASLSADAQDEIRALLPERLDTRNPSRLVPRGACQRKLLARHAKNNKRVFETSPSA